MADASLQMSDLQWNTMVIPLKFTWQPTNDELIYLKQIVCHRMKQRELTPYKQQDNSNPSVIIDNFLYHGDLKHAMNKTLLKELDIRHIINVCDYSLEQDILDQRHVLWINLEDDTYTDISQHFEMTNEFLQSFKVKGQKALVHCQMGVSRSSSIVLAYLMK
jgi:protein-tyrosine phosphatase